MSLLTSICLAFVGGVLPALIWLFFWLKEDEKHPEPNRLIIGTFFMGMLSVPFAFLIESLFNKVFLNGMSIETAFYDHYILAITTIVVWAGSEEIVKYLAAYFGGISKKDNNEPIDPIIYMITAALGFSALENTLFLIHPIFDGYHTTAFITGNMRFIGATLLHVASSAIVGIFMALSYYKNEYFKHRYLLSGFILAITLHSVFNSFIIRSGTFTLIGFSVVWLTIVFIIMEFEKLKVKINNKAPAPPPSTEKKSE